MVEQIGRCEWCGDISQGKCGCPAEVEIDRLRAALFELRDSSREFYNATVGQPGMRLTGRSAVMRNAATISGERLRTLLLGMFLPLDASGSCGGTDGLGA